MLKVKKNQWYKTTGGAYTKILRRYKDEEGDYYLANNTYCYELNGKVLDTTQHSKNLDLVCEVNFIRPSVIYKIFECIEKTFEISLHESKRIILKHYGSLDE